MRNYQQTKNNPFWLRHYLYISMVNLIKDYEETRIEYDEILHSSPSPDGQPRQHGVSSPTESKALRREALGKRCKAVEQTVVYMNGKYSKTCTGEKFNALEAFYSYERFCFFRSKPDKNSAPTVRTWNRYRSEFVYTVAKKLDLV